MNKKIILLLVAALIWICMSGCGTTRDEPVLNALDQTVKGADSSPSSTGDDDLIEMKHWKYSGSSSSVVSDSEAVMAAANSGSGSKKDEAVISLEDQAPPPAAAYAPGNTDKVVTIQLITEEEMEQIMCKLIDLGLMEKYAASQDEFQSAISAFQKENGLPATGTLDSATLQILKK